MVNGNVVIPRGADVNVKLVDDQKSGKIQGRTVLALALSSNVNAVWSTSLLRKFAPKAVLEVLNSAKVIGGTTALGAIIRGIAGGGKGAAIGAGSGAAVGTGAQEVSNDQRVRIASETRLRFFASLQCPPLDQKSRLRLRLRRSPSRLVRHSIHLFFAEGKGLSGRSRRDGPKG